MIIPELILYSLLIFVMVLCAGSIVVSTITLGIAPMPSSNKAYLAMTQLINETGTGTIVDLGSGWGSLVLRIAKINPQRKVIGYEISFLPWLVSITLKKLLGLKNLTLYRQNFFKADLGNASVIVCYLFPEAMIKLSDKLQNENNSIKFIISNNFSLPSLKPYKTVQISDFYRSTIYLYNVQ